MNCVVTNGGRCEEHRGEHRYCTTHHRCISQCWADAKPSYEQLEAEVKRLREAMLAIRVDVNCRQCKDNAIQLDRALGKKA